jgi:hypothetical protein
MAGSVIAGGWETSTSPSASVFSPVGEPSIRTSSAVRVYSPGPAMVKAPTSSGGKPS